MQEVQIISFTPNSPDPLFTVIYAPRGKRPKELPVVGSLLTKITALEFLSPVTHYKLEPAFIFGGDVVLGPAYWDAKRDGGEIKVTPVRKRKKAT